MKITNIQKTAHIIGILQPDGSRLHYMFAAGETKEVPEADSKGILAIEGFEKQKEGLKEKAVAKDSVSVEEKFICQTCGKEAASQLGLIAHERSHK